MPWKSVAVRGKDATQFIRHVEGAGVSRPETNVPDLRSILQYSSRRNFQVPLENGFLTTSTGVLSQRFDINVNLAPSQVSTMVSGLLESVRHVDRFNDYSQKLAITSKGEDGAEICKVVVQAVNGYEFRLLPVAPKWLSQGREGVKVDGRETIEGIDEGLNERALVWSRNLSRDFGIMRRKLNARCVKSVCVEPRVISGTTISEMLDKNLNLELRFEAGYRFNRQFQWAVLEYNAGKAQAAGKSSEAGDWREQVIRPILNGIIEAVQVDLEKPIVYDDYYYTKFSRSVSEFFAERKAAVEKFFEARRERQRKLLQEREDRIAARLKEAGLGRREDSGEICIIQYEPECLLETPPAAAQIGDKTET
jgi:hypothetical protein